jgi:cytoskeletal protein CcmA (bactofilin family)
MALLGTKKDEKTGTNTIPPYREDAVSRPGELSSLLGKGSEFEGKLAFEGQVRIDGKFTGTISTKDVLVIAEGARVSAEVTAGTVIIHGVFEGNIRAAQLVEMKTPGRVKGTIEAPSIAIDRGVMFEGSTKMENLGKGGPVLDAGMPIGGAGGPQKK